MLQEVCKAVQENFVHVFSRLFFFFFLLKRYAGRASNGPIIDLFVTLVTLGVNGWMV
jgi:hypothetical protein